MHTRTASAPATVKTIGLVSSAHFFSHFYMLLLPPLFPMLREVYGVGYTELGLSITVFSMVTALALPPIGFLVDRYGARNILMAGLVLEAVAIGSIAAFPSYPALLACMVLAGLANAVYHPADYAILTGCVAVNRIGRAFSIHTFTGFLGAALAPVVIIFLLTLTDWRTALILCASGGGIVALLMIANSEVLQYASGGSARPADGSTPAAGGFKLLFSLPLLMGLMFFTGLALAGHGVSDFSVAALNALYGTPIAEAGFVLSAYLFAAPVGVLIGGWFADQVTHHDRVVAFCLVAFTAAFATVGLLELSLPLIAVLFVVGGLFGGMVAPSRDMMIRAVTPPGDMGKAFGFVSIGYEIGGIAAPLLFGFLLDHRDARMVFWLVGLLGFATIATVFATGRVGRRLLAEERA